MATNMPFLREWDSCAGIKADFGASFPAEAVTKRFGVKGVGIDLAYQAILYEARTIAGNVNPTVNGTYRSTLHVGSLNLRVNF